jgi:hypothetical protein
MRRLGPIASALIVSALFLVAYAPAANAAAGSISGGGTMIDENGTRWSFGGSVHVGPAGQATGHFELVRHLAPTYRPTVCQWNSFSNASVVGNTATFDAVGTCMGENEFGTWQFTATNHFTIVDAGGAGQDAIDINFLGPSGIALPGGPITNGNFQVRG